jgi:hypothetical protein
MFSRVFQSTSKLTTTKTTTTGTAAEEQIKKPRRRPPVYEESVAMLAGSLLIYFLADLRDMVRAGEITGKTLLEPPMTTEQIMQQIQENKEALKARAIDHEDLQKRLDALQSLKEEGIFQSMFGSKQSTIMTHFVDANGE